MRMAGCHRARVARAVWRSRRRHCWDIVFRRGGACLPPCRRHCRGTTEAGAEWSTGQGRLRCAVLPLAGEADRALVWLPFSLIASGSSGSAHLEGLVIRGALAEKLGSIQATLESLRRICAADDCEMFLLDAHAKEVFLVDCVGRDRDAFLEKTHMPLGSGYPGAVTLHQKPLFTNRFQKDRLFLRGSVKRCGIRSFIGVPIVEQGSALGYVGIGWRDESIPMEWGLRVLEEVRNILPIAVSGRSAMPPVRQPPAGLVLRCLGPLEISIDGARLQPEAFKRRKALKLLRTLVVLRGASVHRDKLAEMLWPGSPHEAAVNRLHGVINVLRSCLESRRPARESHYILRRDDCFFFNLDAPHSIDLFDFLDAESLARKALHQGDEERAMSLLERAIQLYRGDLFADDTEDEAIDVARIRLRQLYLDAVRTLLPLQTIRGRTDAAVHALRRALDIEPVAIDLNETLVILLIDAGRRAEARQQYECCRASLLKYLDMEPTERMRALEKALY